MFYIQDVQCLDRRHEKIKITAHVPQYEIYAVQLGFDIKRCCEAAVHALRNFLYNNSEDKVLFIFDVKNAYNTVNRNALLNEVMLDVPEIYDYFLQCCSETAKLAYRDN